jgi:hypothetical protein
MTPFDFIHDQIKKRYGYEKYYNPDIELIDIKERLNKGLLSPISAEKKITNFYKKFIIKTKKFH